MVEHLPLAAATPKATTGIPGFDRMSGGGLPVGRISAAIGAAGAGKTIFAMHTLVHRIRQTGGVGLFVSFEQSEEGMKADLGSFEWGVDELLSDGRLLLIDGRPQPDMLISGHFDIAGLLAMIKGACDPQPPACVVFDGIDTLMALLGSPTAQRTELLRLQDHVRRLDTMVILTIKADPAGGDGFEDIALYMADCVVELLRNVGEGASSRGLRIQKYRGSSHNLSLVPMLITEHGIELESLDADRQSIPIFNERVSMGIPQLDDMLAGGLYRGSSTLLSGSPGTAKTTLGASFLDAMARNGERALGICFDERPEEIIRNVSSVGIDLGRHVASGALRMHAISNRSAGPDEFAHEINQEIAAFKPRHLLIDPISTFTGDMASQHAVFRIIQLCKREGITVVLTSLLDRATGEAESSRSYVSTLCDTWIHLSYVVNGGERNRAITIVKSRGTGHSSQVGELLMGDNGISIAEAYTENGAVLMGALRWQKERSNLQAVREAEEQAQRDYRNAERSMQELAERIATLNSELEAKRQDLDKLQQHTVMARQQEADRREQLEQLRRSGETRVLHPGGRS